MADFDTPIIPTEQATNDVATAIPLSFQLTDDGKLLAVVEAGENRPSCNEAMIKETLAEQGWSDLFLHENSLSQLVAQYNTVNESFNLEIGERRDGSCLIKIDDDKMAARLTLIPPYGGEPAGMEQLQAALQEQSIVNGLMNAEIKAALKEGVAVELIIAQGQCPVPGENARFISQVPEIRERKPKIDEKGVANYRDLGQLIVVKKGDLLMRRIPATEGKEGMNVLGQVIAPQPGQDVSFPSGLQGIEIDPDDNNLLRAAITGQPKLVPNGVIVEPTVNLPLVDLSTGNVNFIGTINIKGDVKDGMSVRASGDVFVGGTVEAAEIEAEGNIVIKGGVIGHSEHTANPEEAIAFNARIRSKASISVHFAENACMEAGTDIIIEEFSMHNHLTASHRILIGKSGSKKGRIIGGIACASTLVKAAVFGSNAGFVTKIRAGFNPHQQAKLDKLRLEIDENEKEQEDLKKIIAFVLAHPDKDKNDLLHKAVHTREKLEADCVQLHAEHSHLQAEMTMPENVQVIAEEAVHCGTEIQIGQYVWKNNEERGKGVFHIVGGEIVFENIMLDLSKLV
ncbi:MAG: DUF342 domain-containing protein [Methylobacter sp.]